MLLMEIQCQIKYFFEITVTANHQDITHKSNLRRVNHDLSSGNFYCSRKYHMMRGPLLCFSSIGYFLEAELFKNFWWDYPFGEPVPPRGDLLPFGP